MFDHFLSNFNIIQEIIPTSNIIYEVQYSTICVMSKVVAVLGPERISAPVVIVAICQTNTTKEHLSCYCLIHLHVCIRYALLLSRKVFNNIDGQSTGICTNDFITHSFKVCNLFSKVYLVLQMLQFRC